jgi:hypothetical protein
MLAYGRSMLHVDFSELTAAYMDLSTTISEFYFRFRPYLDSALKRAAEELSEEEEVEETYQVSVLCQATPIL